MPELETHRLNGRDIYIHKPPITTGETLRLLILMDGQQEINPGERTPSTPAILDKLYADNELLPQITVFIPAPRDFMERVHEYACNPEFTHFLTYELVPYMQTQFNCGTHRDAITIGGTSFSGLAATYAALTHPDVFGEVLAQSGAFWWYEGWERFSPQDTWHDAAQTTLLDSTQSANAMAWLNTIPSSNPNFPVHLYLDGGTSENQHTPSLDGEAFPGAITLNQTLQEKLHESHPEHLITERVRPDAGEHTPDSWQHNKTNAFKSLQLKRTEHIEETATEAYKQQILKIKSADSNPESDSNPTPSI